MKNHTVGTVFNPESAAHHSRWHGQILALRMIVVAGWLGLTAIALRAQENQLEVDVRPAVTDKSVMWSHKPKAPDEGGHGKIYGIAKVEEIKTDMRLAKPVNEGALVSIVLNELDRNGFREFKRGEKPDILLTVSYGRGELSNPYIRDGGETGGGNQGGQFAAAAAAASGAPSGPTENDSGATTVTITGAFSQQLMDEKTPGFEAKLQKAGFEKLYIRITAWDFPTSAKTRSKMLWKTVMCVDDPDHRDLNAIAAKMLEAGAPFFDKEIREPEATIFKPVQDGRVNVGTPEVVQPTSK